MNFNTLFFSIIFVRENFSVIKCISIKNTNHASLTFIPYPSAIKTPIDIPKTFDPVSPIMPLAFKSVLKYANTFGSIRSGNTFVYPVNVIYIGIIITKYAFIALPGLKSNKFIKFVESAMIYVFTIISTISFEIHTETTNPTNPPNKALNPPVVSSPFNKLLK